MNNVDKMKNNLSNAFIFRLSGVGQYKNDKELYLRKNTTVEIISKSKFIIRRYFCENKIRQIRRYKNYKLDGQYAEWFVNGGKKAETTYKNGKRDGKYTEWGQWSGKTVKYKEIDYNNGRINGLYIIYHINGQKAFEEKYINGKLLSRLSWLEDGTLHWTWEAGKY